MTGRLAAALACAALATACAHAAGTRVEQGVQEIDAEHSPEKLLARGEAFASVGDLTRAEQYLAAALEAGADPDRVMPTLVRVCVDGKRFRVALDYAEPQLRRRPSDYRLRFVVASLYLLLGDVGRAREGFEGVVAANPDDANAQYTLACLLRDDVGERLKADGHFREYLRLDPEGPHAEEARASLLKTVP